MGTSTKKSFSSRFKAKVALEAADRNTVQELSNKYDVPAFEIEAWKYVLKDGRYFERTAVPFKVGSRIIGQIIHYVDVSRFKEKEGKAESLCRFAGLHQ